MGHSDKERESCTGREILSNMFLCVCVCVCVCVFVWEACSPSIAYAENHDEVKNNETSNDVLQNMRKILTVVSTEKCAIIILE